MDTTPALLWLISIAVLVNMGFLFTMGKCCKAVLKCCEEVKSTGGPGGGATPIPIFGTLWDNTATKAGGCVLDAADTLLAGWTVTITPDGAAAPTHTLTTNSQGRFGTLLDPGNYSVEVVPPAGNTLAMCQGMTNPRVVTVPASGSATANFALQS